MISGLNHTAYMLAEFILAIWASQWRLPKHHVRLASGWWPPQGQPGLDPQDLFGKFPSDSSHVISSPFPELCSAHATLRIVALWARSRASTRLPPATEAPCWVWVTADSVCVSCRVGSPATMRECERWHLSKGGTSRTSPKQQQRFVRRAFVPAPPDVEIGESL